MYAYNHLNAFNKSHPRTGWQSYYFTIIITFNVDISSLKNLLLWDCEGMQARVVACYIVTLTSWPLSSLLSPLASLCSPCSSGFGPHTLTLSLIVFVVCNMWKIRSLGDVVLCRLFSLSFRVYSSLLVIEIMLYDDNISIKIMDNYQVINISKSVKCKTFNIRLVCLV